MAKSKFDGKHWTTCPAGVTIFGIEGVATPSGEWIVDGQPMQPLPENDNIMAEAIACIDQDCRADSYTSVSQLVLAPREAVLFFLEGSMDVGDLRRAEEGEDEIIVRDFYIGTYHLNLHILKNPPYKLYTADGTGKLIP